jgi:LuxR family transcriptional regulator, activator of conjugal transfer of Ti plasmids
MKDQINSAIITFDLDLLYAVAQSATTDDLRAAAARFSAKQGFSRWIYGVVGPDKVLTNYPATWLARYAKHRWHRGRDPFLNAIHERRRAVSWDLRQTRPFGRSLDAVQKGMLADRWDAGVCTGVTAPVYDRPAQACEFAVVSFSRETPMSDIERRHQEPHVQLFATYFQSAAATLLGPLNRRRDAIGVSLSPREQNCLSWAAIGKSNWEIGQLLNISVATVNFHLGNAATKLGVRGRVLAIGRAIRLGLINPV